MCSIIGFLPEISPSPEVIKNMLKWGEKRGTDAFGCFIFDNFGTLFHSQKQPYIPDKKTTSEILARELKPGYMMLASYRSAPETEIESSDWESIQPILHRTSNNICLVHNGSVSNRIYNELRQDIIPESKIDSEAIIWAYGKFNCDMKKTMEYLSGGFAFLMVDFSLRKLYAVCTHNPLYCGYVKGFGLFFASMEEAIYDVISIVKDTKISRQNIVRWEDFYAREMPENTITEFDLDSSKINEIKFLPRYIHPNYDPLKKVNMNKTKVLVAASGGLDSTTTLAVLKKAGYDITAVYFNYGHRGELAEEFALNEICKVLSIPTVKFDIRNNMKILDSSSMLTDPNHKITTGTENDLKTTIAWTCFRNGLFLTYMGATAESLIINKGYDEIYITGGYSNLTESGVFIDNSERFVNSFFKFAKFASIVGTKIKPLYCCVNLLKTEQYILLNKFGLLNRLGKYMISCDRPAIRNGNGDGVYPANCSKHGKPACGSGALSRWAIDRLGLEDPRRYYEVDDSEYILYKPSKSDAQYVWPTIDQILSKLQIHDVNMNILKKHLGILS